MEARVGTGSGGDGLRHDHEEGGGGGTSVGDSTNRQTGEGPAKDKWLENRYGNERSMNGKRQRSSLLTPSAPGSRNNSAIGLPCVARPPRCTPVSVPGQHACTQVIRFLRQPSPRASTYLFAARKCTDGYCRRTLEESPPRPPRRQWRRPSSVSRRRTRPRFQRRCATGQQHIGSDTTDISLESPHSRSVLASKSCSMAVRPTLHQGRHSPWHVRRRRR